MSSAASSLQPGEVTTRELELKWTARLEQWGSLNAYVSGEKVAAEIVTDLRSLTVCDSASVTLRQARELGGYSVDHLQKLVASGHLENIGRKNRPRIRRSDVPIKPGYALRRSGELVLSERRRIVASVATNGNEEHS
jgi:hypothetical protein